MCLVTVTRVGITMAGIDFGNSVKCLEVPHILPKLYYYSLKEDVWKV